jgi:hypothetical protein
MPTSVLPALRAAAERQFPDCGNPEVHRQKAQNEEGGPCQPTPEYGCSLVRGLCRVRHYEPMNYVDDIRIVRPISDALVYSSSCEVQRLSPAEHEKRTATSRESELPPCEPPEGGPIQGRHPSIS